MSMDLRLFFFALSLQSPVGIYGVKSQETTTPYPKSWSP